MGVSVSRWTMTYFGAALTSFVLAQSLFVAGFTAPDRSWSAPPMLVVVHLLTIGWLTLLILGALQQFVPVLTTKPLTSQRLAGVTLALILVGLPLMLVGFLALEPWAAEVGKQWLPTGGGLVVAGAVAACFNLGLTLWRSRPLTLPGRFIVAGLVFLMLTVGMGVVFALAYAVPDLWSPEFIGRLLINGLNLHVTAGIGGWFTLTAIGVAYKLLAMFALAPEDRGMIGGWIFLTITAGFSLVVSAAWLQIFGAAAHLGGSLATLGWVLAAFGGALYLYDMWQLFAQRARSLLELNARVGGWALITLGLGLPLLVMLALTGPDRQQTVAAAFVYLLLFGWLSGLGLSQLYKIVPFLTWLERYGPRLGREQVPRVQDLVNETRDRPWFAGYFVGVGLAVCSILFDRPDLLRVASSVTLVGTIGITLRLLVVRFGRHQPGPDWIPH